MDDVAGVFCQALSDDMYFVVEGTLAVIADGREAGSYTRST